MPMLTTPMATPSSTTSTTIITTLLVLGPHNGPRNSSIGLATLRLDGFGGVSGTGVATTVPIKVTGPTLTISVDLLAPGGSVRIGAKGASSLGVDASTLITANSTDAAVQFADGKSFASLVGSNVTLVILAKDAIVYTVGFAA